MNRRFLIRRSARHDIQEARNWYEANDSNAADRFFKEVVRGFRKISANPLSFPKILPRVHQMELRKFPYSLIYLVEDDFVSVLKVVHHRQDDAAFLEQIAEELGRDQ